METQGTVLRARGAPRLRSNLGLIGTRASFLGGGIWVASLTALLLAPRARRQGVRTVSDAFVSAFIVSSRGSSGLRHALVGPVAVSHGENPLACLAGPILPQRSAYSGAQHRLMVLGIFLSNLYQPGKKGLLRNVSGNGHTPPMQLLQQAHQARRKGRPLQLSQLPRVRHLALREVQKVFEALQVRELRLRRAVGEYPWVPTLSG